MRVLIVGAGIAGLTLAAKLRQQGRDPVMVERSSSEPGGYAIALYPLGSCVLHGLGRYDELLDRGVVSQHYQMLDGAGRPLQQMDMSVLTADAGPAITAERGDLIDILRQACGDLPIRTGTTVRSLTQDDDGVSATFQDGARDHFDLVVACDGIHSTTRAAADIDGATYDTGWTVWTWWGPEGLVPADTGREYWGSGWFLGAYPVRGRCMYVVGLPHAVLDPHADQATARARVTEVLGNLASGPGLPRLLDEGMPLYPWPMTDVRAPTWSRGRVALCGDAAVGFLPTAGVGASNAMRAAAALADELSRADAEHVPLALGMYQKRCRRIIESNQQDSRNIARYMFLSSPTLGRIRNTVLAHYPIRRAIRQIVRSMHQPL